jgi:uncharacterized protein
MTSSAVSIAATHLPTGTELAGLKTATGATTRRERVSGIDVLRGFALLGILVLNINNFAGPEAGHDIPFNAFSGPHTTINLITFYIKWFFFEGKMRGIFSMLFGAGVILMTSRAERRGAAQGVADIYLRRNMLLVLIGFLHGWLIWDGDILFDYGLVALLFLYPLRKLAAKTLLIAGTVISLVVATYCVAISFAHIDQSVALMNQATAIAARQHAGLALTQDDKKVTQKWQELLEKHQLTPEKIQKKIAAANQGYLKTIGENLDGFTDNLYRHVLFIPDSVSAMMIGMGLMQMGFFSGTLSYFSYFLTALIGFAISIPIYAVGLTKVVASNVDFITFQKWLFIPYYLTREAGMIAIAAVVVMIIKSGRLRTVQRLLAAVGQTALSNYLMTSLICQFVFLWGPWKLYGHLEYYQLNYVVAAVWTFNFLFSTLWLRTFAFGPVEWAWRSMTYGKAQPMLLATRTA